MPKIREKLQLGIGDYNLLNTFRKNLA